MHLVTCFSKANLFRKVSSSLIENGHPELMQSPEHFDFTVTCLSPSKMKKVTPLHLIEITRMKAVLTKLPDDVVRRIKEKYVKKIMILH